MAANQSSPGVVVQERDLTTVSTVSTANIGVIAAPFELGPVEEIIEVSGERQLAEAVSYTHLTLPTSDLV